MDALSDVAVFVRVVERGSFTAAAADLRLSKAAVSKFVGRLEARLGARLLNRTTRKLTLTEAGTLFFRRGSGALTELADAEQEVAQLTAAPRGVLRVSAPMSFGLEHLAPRVPAFLARHPAIALELELDDRFVDLVRERVDVAVRIAQLADSSLIARRIAPCRVVACAAPAYLKRHGTPATPAELTRHNCLTYSLLRGPQDWRFQAAGGRPVAVSVRGTLRCNNALVLRQAALAGAGILYVPTFYVGRELADGLLVPVLTGHKIPELSISAVYPERKQLAPKVRAFVDFLAECFGPEPYWDAPARPRRIRANTAHTR
jgi:DNA-binding transcriptional LysR family regulator